MNWQVAVPAYGRDYKSAKDVRDAWNRGLDFLAMPTEQYVNREDAAGTPNSASSSSSTPRAIGARPNEHHNLHPYFRGDDYKKSHRPVPEDRYQGKHSLHPHRYGSSGRRVHRQGVRAR